MSDISDSEPPVESEPVKKKKAKKRPSDFEIVRTILQRTHERKLPYLLKNLGEDSDVLFFCSADESGFTYGSCDIAIAIFEITDPELSAIIESYLVKLYGLNTPHGYQCIINVRDQISELSKTKGETIESDVKTDGAGSSWVIRTDTQGKERTQYFSKSIDSLFHMQVVKSWCERYRPLMTTKDPAYLYYPYRHPDGDTATMMTLPAIYVNYSPLVTLFPNGFRVMTTRGVDVITDKFLEEFPYPVVSEEMVVFQEASACCQMAHRIEAVGWRMILLRPNAVFFPTLTTPLLEPGHQNL